MPRTCRAGLSVPRKQRATGWALHTSPHASHLDSPTIRLPATSTMSHTARREYSKLQVICIASTTGRRCASWVHEIPGPQAPLQNGHVPSGHDVRDETRACWASLTWWGGIHCPRQKGVTVDGWIFAENLQPLAFLTGYTLYDEEYDWVATEHGIKETN